MKKIKKYQTPPEEATPTILHIIQLFEMIPYYKNMSAR